VQPDRVQVRRHAEAADDGALLRADHGSDRRHAAGDSRGAAAGGDGATRAVVALIAASAIALAAFARFHHDLSIDEPFTALAVAQPASLGATLVHDDIPLFYVLLLGWTRVFGASAFALRALSLAAFGAAIAFSAAAARIVASRRAAWLTAVLVACSVT